MITLVETEPYRKRKAAYQTVFKSAYGSEVLADLSSCCFAFETCAVPGNDHETWMNEGMRLVWIRIQQFLFLTPEQLRKFYPGLESREEVLDLYKRMAFIDKLGGTHG